MKEWRTVAEFPNYLVSNSGEIMNRKTKHILTQRDKQGYMVVQLSKTIDGNQIKKQKFVHRLVAAAFLDNEKKYPQVNHKDHNTKNNHVDNLEWCTASYNVNYADANKRRAGTLGKPIYAINLRDKRSQMYKSVIGCARDLNISHMSIVHILKKQRGSKSAKGYTFVEADKYDEHKLAKYISDAASGNKPYARPVIGWKVDNPSRKKNFSSIAEAAKETGNFESGIRNVLKGSYKQTHGWKFILEKN